MKVKYTPGAPDGTNGKSYRVEITKIVTMENKHIVMPMLKAVQIKFKDGKKQWITGQQFLDRIDMVQSAVEKQFV